MEEIRRQIDETDAEIRRCLVRRVRLSLQMAECKRERGERTVFRPEREAEILRRFCADMPGLEGAACVSAQRGVMSASRMLQYDRMARWHPETVDALFAAFSVPADPKGVRVEMTLPDGHFLPAVLTSAADLGICVREVAAGPDSVCCMTLLGSVREDGLRGLLYRMAMESRGFAVTAVF